MTSGCLAGSHEQDRPSTSQSGVGFLPRVIPSKAGQTATYGQVGNEVPVNPPFPQFPGVIQAVGNADHALATMGSSNPIRSDDAP